MGGKWGSREDQGEIPNVSIKLRHNPPKGDRRVGVRFDHFLALVWWSIVKKRGDQRIRTYSITRTEVRVHLSNH